MLIFYFADSSPLKMKMLEPLMLKIPTVAWSYIAANAQNFLWERQRCCYKALKFLFFLLTPYDANYIRGH